MRLLPCVHPGSGRAGDAGRPARIRSFAASRESCGIAGAAMMHAEMDVARCRLAGLLLYQGLLLPPVLGIGSFVFPRMLGGDFGEAKTAAQSHVKLLRAIAAAVLLVSSFFLEAHGLVAVGYALRALVAAGYLLIEVRWRPQQAGSLTTGLFWALALGCVGLVLSPFHYGQHVSIEHLLYIGGFGLLMLIVGSRVLFSHSGDLEGFFAKSKWVRFLIFLGILTAPPRATPRATPRLGSLHDRFHHIYAACARGLVRFALAAVASTSIGDA